MTLSTATKAILLLAANPLGTARLRLDQEVREIEERLSRSKNREQFALNPKWAVRADDLRQALLEVDPHIVHFCGHGAGDEGLAFETETGQVQLVSADALAGLFELFAEQVECVLLNACYSEVQATAISQHINYVIGMSQAIEDRTALKFAAGFYDALGAGRSIEVAYKFGCNAIQLEGIPQHLVPVLKRKSAIASSATTPPLQPPVATAIRPAIEVFFSYSHKDEAWRDQLAAHLSNLQRQNVIHQWHDRQILPGTEWNGEIDSHLNQAHVILLLVSADFLASDYCWDIEVTYAMQRHQAGSARVVPILLRPTDWQGTPFSRLQPLPSDARPITRWDDRDEALLNVAHGIRAVVEAFTQAEPEPAVSTTGMTSRSFSAAETPKPGPENLPRSGVVSFVGRSPALTELHQWLHDRDQPAIVALTGMAGVGKTELALQYARQHLTDYPGGLCWVSARTAQVGTQILDFARLYFNLTPPTTLTLLQQVALCWQQWAPGQVLLLLDDVADYQQVEPFLPPMASRFKVLLTTRRQFGATIRKLTLEALPPDVSLTLLRSLVGTERLQAEPAIAEQLCTELGGLPLGLELVGRYLSRKPDLSLARMQQRLTEKGLSDRATRDAEAEMTARLGIQAAFDLSWELLSDEARLLGGLLSLFAAAPIPWTLVERCYPDLDPDDLEDLRDDYWMNLHLLQRKQEGIYQLNQLIRRFLQAKDDDDTAQREALGQRFCRAMVTLAEQIPEEPTRDRVMALRPAMPHLAAAATTLHAYLSDADLIKPFQGLGRFYAGQGFYDQAEDWYKQCRATVEQRFGAEHPIVATSLCHLGWVYHLQGRYGEAEPLFVLALALRQRLLGEEHLDVADSLNYLALLHQDQGEYEQAEPLAVRSLALRQQLLGTDHLDIADSLNNLALLYQDQGRYTEAEPLYTQAWAMRQRLMGEDYPRIASSLNNLAYCYAAQDRYAEAESLYLQAKAMYQRLLGEEHPDFAISLNNLAQLYDLQGRYAEAEPLFAQALAINQRVLGEEHPNVATSLNSLGAVYDIQGRHAEAEPLYLQALELRQRLLGADHPLVAISLNNLAKLYVAQNRNREAKPLYPRALTILEQRLGTDHPVTTKVRSNLEEWQRATKQRSKAE